MEHPSAPPKDSLGAWGTPQTPPGGLGYPMDTPWPSLRGIGHRTPHPPQNPLGAQGTPQTPPKHPLGTQGTPEPPPKGPEYQTDPT